MSLGICMGAVWYKCTDTSDSSLLNDSQHLKCHLFILFRNKHNFPFVGLVAQSVYRLSYGLDGPGIESRWGREFPHLSRPTLGPTQPSVKWVPCLSRG